MAGQPSSTTPRLPRPGSRFARSWLLAATSALALACANADGGHQGEDADASEPPAGANADASVQGPSNAYTWDLPPGFPLPPVPEDNPMSAAKVELGRHLFYDARLSNNRAQSCASCHDQARAFTDGKPQGVGSTGEVHPRGAMSLANVAYASTLTWANPLMDALERQALLPLFGDAPIELGLRSIGQLEERLREEPRYHDMFAEAYPEADEPVTANHATKALAAFQRTLISGNSPYDRWLFEGDDSGMSDAAKQGYELFNSERLECFHCHLGFNLTDHFHFQDKPFFDRPYHNTALYNIDGAGAYPPENTGVHGVTQRASDMGRFKAPTLRNIALTAPYMHDGSIATLDGVLDHYAAGGRTISEGKRAGVGSESPLRSELIRGFEITEQERAAVIAFLESLTDEEFLSDPRFSNPWE